MIFLCRTGPPGTSFDLPVTIVFSWKDENDDGLEDRRNIQEDILPYFTITNFLGWCYETLGCDREANTWTFEVMSFSELVLDSR